ncbi:MAG TPA: hypothetical protein VGM13_08730 [Thermoanaerobaculia bacterium]
MKDVHADTADPAIPFSKAHGAASGGYSARGLDDAVRRGDLKVFWHEGRRFVLASEMSRFLVGRAARRARPKPKGTPTR